MRANDVPDFPDPGCAHPQTPIRSTKTVLPSSGSPAFNHAVQLCSRGGQIGVKLANRSDAAVRSP